MKPALPELLLLGIIAASSQVREIGSLASDPFFPIPPDQIRGRYKDYFGEEVYELAAQFQWAGESYGYLRVGLHPSGGILRGRTFPTGSVPPAEEGLRSRTETCAPATNPFSHP